MEASLPMDITLRVRSTLEIIRFAGANHLCVDLRYDGSIRRIEPPCVLITRVLLL